MSARRRPFGWLFALVTTVVVTGAPLGAQRFPQAMPSPPPPPPGRVDAALLSSWVEAVERHEPGVRDSALMGAARWSGSELRRLWADVQVLILVTAAPGRTTFRVASALAPAGRSRDIQVSLGAKSDREVVRTLARHLRDAGIAPTLRRAALLHTDVALLAPEVAQQSAGPAALGAAVKALVGDGQRTGSESIGVHWSFARLVLSRLAPSPRAHPFVRDWYRATVADAQRIDYWDAVQLDHGLALFPSDPVLLFLKGCQHEAYAAPLYQAFARSITDRTLRPDIDDAAKELDRAQEAFTAALAGDPALTEARLHLGRVLGLKGARQAAIQELERALAAGLDPDLEYFARLFLGAEHQAGGALVEARAQFRRAAALDPAGRVAPLALAQIAGALGEREDMRPALARALVPPAAGAPPERWQLYRVSQGRRASAWLDAVRKAWARDEP